MVIVLYLKLLVEMRKNRTSGPTNFNEFNYLRALSVIIFNNHKFKLLTTIRDFVMDLATTQSLLQSLLISGLADPNQRNLHVFKTEEVFVLV